MRFSGCNPRRVEHNVTILDGERRGLVLRRVGKASPMQGRSMMRIRCAIGLAITVGLASQALGQSGTFRAAFLGLNSGRTPTGIAVGDFDENGVMDAVTANSSNGTISVFLDVYVYGYPNPDIAVGGVPDAIVAGKFDGDDHLDLVVANGSTSIVCLKGNGGGGFAVVNPPIEVGANPAALASGDFNDDGKLDLAVANEGESEGGSGSVSVLLGNGDCTFTLATTLAGQGKTWAVAVGDVNGDDHPDILAVNGRSSSCSVFLNNGHGTTFSSAGTFATGPEPTGVAVAHLDADGHLDAIVSERNADDVAVYRGDGNGSFALGGTYAVGTFPSAVITGDLDGDSHPDVVVANEFSVDVSVLLGDGNGGLVETGSFVADGQPAALALADMDGDGSTDVVTANVVGGDGSVAILVNRGGGILHAVEDVRATMGPSSTLTGDLDDDGLPEVVLTQDSGNVLVFKTTNAGMLAIHGTITVEGKLRRGTLVDLNGDGRLDLAVVDNAGDRIVVMPGNGDGTFGTPQELPTGTGPAAIASGDFNGDGVVDLAATVFGPPGIVTVFLGRGDGGFQNPCSTTVGEAPVEILARNLDALDAEPPDRKDDLVVVNEASNTVSVLWSADGCSFQTTELAGRGPKAVAVALLNADALPDVVVGNSVSSQQPSVQVYLGNANRTFIAGSPVPGSNRVDALVARDFSGDGLVDLLAVDLTSNVAQLRRGRGDGRFFLDTEANVSQMPVFVSAGDIDGDGRYDAATANSAVTANNMSVLINCVGDPICAEGPAPAMRGDGNADGLLSAADLVAVVSEVFDGDGQQIEDIKRGTFVAGPGVDANGDGRVDVQDDRAVIHRIFAGGQAT
jgi:hypothetical protein